MISNNGISIVTPVWNNMEYLPKYFETLKANTEIDHEIIIVDQGSTDGSIDYCVKQGVDKIILNKKNTGSTGGWNQGIEIAEYPLAMVLNSDVEIRFKGWLKRMKQEMAEDTAIVECLEITPLEKVTRWAGAASFLLRKRSWRDIGKFDENFFPGFNGDTDFWCRLHWRGWKLGWCREILLFHWCGGTHRRGQLKDSQTRDWQDGENTKNTKWNVVTYNNLWWKFRQEQEDWLKSERTAGRLK